MEVHVPKVCIVEIAAVAKRLAGRALAERASKGIMKSYKIAEEEAIFDIAWDVALETGCSGFDSYFIALAKREDAILFTDDSGMHHHAEYVDVNSILVRCADLKTLERMLE